MGNNIVSSVIKVFDRGHLEIESISAKIDRAQINGCREKHEVYMGSAGIFQTSATNVQHRNATDNKQVRWKLTNTTEQSF